MNVIICDNNSENLKSAKEAIKGKGKVETVEMDVSKVEDFEKLKVLVEKGFDGMFLPSVDSIFQIDTHVLCQVLCKIPIVPIQ